MDGLSLSILNFGGFCETSGRALDGLSVSVLGFGGFCGSASQFQCSGVENSISPRFKGEMKFEDNVALYCVLCCGDPGPGEQVKATRASGWAEPFNPDFW